MFKESEKDYFRYRHWKKLHASSDTEEDLNDFYADLGAGDLGFEEQDVPELSSMELTEQAKQTRDITLARKMLRKAITLWPDNYDAFEELTAIRKINDLTYAKALDKKACEVYEELRKKKVIRRGVDLHDDKQYHSYLRLLYHAAMAYQVAKDYDSSIDVCLTLLEVNPGDNLGVRYLLWNCYIYFEGYEKEFLKSYAKYPRNPCALGYRVLFEFYRENAPAAKRYLFELRKVNLGMFYFLISNDAEWMPSSVDNALGYRHGSIEETMAFCHDTAYLLEDLEFAGVARSPRPEMALEKTERYFPAFLLFVSTLDKDGFTTKKRFEDKGYGREDFGGPHDELFGILNSIEQPEGLYEELKEHRLIEDAIDIDKAFELEDDVDEQKLHDALFDPNRQTISPQGHQLGLLIRYSFEHDPEGQSSFYDGTRPTA
ncbi:MAG: hypothetical protein SPL80_06355 [Bacilli bacterium]|nr:hypothetical protein [Bacilli bacterium]